MGLKSLTQLAAILGIMAVSSGQLPQIIKAIKVAQFHLIQDSKASKWPKAMLLPITK